MNKNTISWFFLFENFDNKSLTKKKKQLIIKNQKQPFKSIQFISDNRTNNKKTVKTNVTEWRFSFFTLFMADIPMNHM